MAFLRSNLFSKSTGIVLKGALVAGVIPMFLGSGKAEAATLAAAYLIVDQSAPVATPDAPAMTPFTVTGTTTLEFAINGSGKATGATELVEDFSLRVDAPLSYSSHTGSLNTGSGEGPNPTSAARINSESQVWDDVAIVSDGTTDAPNNIDFGEDATVTFDQFAGGFDYLVIAEDAGFDPFRLDLCPTATCDSGVTTIFDGFLSDAVRANAVTDRADVSAADTSNAGNMDTVFVFLFDSKVTDFVRITEIGNPYSNSARLEVDFVGVGTTPVPLPAGMWLMIGGLGAFGAMRRAKKRKS